MKYYDIITVYLLKNKYEFIVRWICHLQLISSFYLFLNKLFREIITLAQTELVLPQISFKPYSQIPYFIEYSVLFFTLKMMLKYSLHTIHGR